MAVQEKQLSPAAVEPPDSAQDKPATPAPEEIYTPIEAAIDEEAQRTVCCCDEPVTKDGKKPILSLHGEDVDESSCEMRKAS